MNGINEITRLDLKKYKENLKFKNHGKLTFPLFRLPAKEKKHYNGFKVDILVTTFHRQFISSPYSLHTS